MTNYRRYSTILGFLGALLIASGMMFKDIYIYSPSIGWIGAFLSFILAAFFITKDKKEKNK